MKYEVQLISAIFGAIGGTISGLIIAFISPYAKWKFDSSLSNREKQRSYINNLICQLEEANKSDNFLRRFLLLNDISTEIAKFYNKLEKDQLNEIEKEILEIKEENQKSFEIYGFDMKPAENKVSKKYYSFLRKVIKRVYKV